MVNEVLITFVTMQEENFLCTMSVLNREASFGRFLNTKA